MKKLLIVLVLMAVAGCRSETEFGQCVGLDSQEDNPELVYSFSTRNAVVAVVFVETVVVPVVWILDYARCPVAKKALTQ